LNGSDFYIKLCRIQKAEVCRESFIPDPKRLARVEKRLSSSFGMFDDEDDKPQKVIVRFPANEYYNRIFTERRYHHSQKLSKNASGKTILTMTVPVGLELVNWVLTWSEAEVMEPADLKAMLLEAGKQLVKKYKR
jgi:predicted DNA-binding transcriptional regulator YafY